MPAPLGRMLGSAPDVSLAVSLTLAWDPAPLCASGEAQKACGGPGPRAQPFPGPWVGVCPISGPPEASERWRLSLCDFSIPRTAAEGLGDVLSSTVIIYKARFL